MPAARPPAQAYETRAKGAYWLSALRLTDFRNYEALSLDLDPRPVVLVGANGSGKTNLLEGVSFLVPGRGLRAAAHDEIAREGGAGGWTVFARVEGPDGMAEIGTGISPARPAERGSREVHIDGARARTVNDLAFVCRMVWLTPAMDSLFTGPASERRRFLDRLVLAMDATHRSRINAFETAMRQRNALLETPRADATWLDGLEAQMAEHGAAIAAARREFVRMLQGVLTERGGKGPFPEAHLALEGAIESDLASMPAIDAEDRYRDELARARPADAAAKRTLAGPHRSDMVVYYGPKGRPARLCSTGEQKIVLVGLVLAHARLIGALHDHGTPLVLLDEIAAHLDKRHRDALFAELGELGAQAWMTGTELAIFGGLTTAQSFEVTAGKLRKLA